MESLPVGEADFATPDRVVQLGLPPYRIDVLTSITGVGFAEAWLERTEGTLFGVSVAFLGRASFISQSRGCSRWCLVASWYAFATRSSSLSPNGRAKNVTAEGEPPGRKPLGIESAG